MFLKSVEKPGKMFCFSALLCASLLLLAGCPKQDYKPAPKKPPIKTGPKLPSEKKAYPKPYYVNGKWYQPLPHSRGFKQVGIASWYGKDFHGKPTSSGEIYDMYKVSAAHKILPLGTWVRVTNLENDRSLDVRINDRGPFISGRVIDLSFAAAKKLRIVGPGTADVRVIALGNRTRRDTKYGKKIDEYTPVNFYKGNFTIQVGAFEKKENAVKFMKRLGVKYKNAHMSTYYSHKDGKTLYRVLVGRVTSLDKAEEYAKILKKRGHGTAFVVAE